MREQRWYGVSPLVLAAGLTTLVWAAVIGAPAAHAGSRGPVGSLSVGDAIFWQGHYAEDSDGLLPALPGLPEEDPCSEGECFEYAIELEERGHRLRVALDTPDCEDGFGLELIDPNGSLVDDDVSCYSAEVYAARPGKGTWLVRVDPFDVTAAIFRMRAKLEGERPTPQKRRVLLPNLRVEPPHQFTFNTGGPGSCYEDETIEDGARRCLRFSVGPQNAGKGPLELKFSRLTEMGTQAVMYQRLYYTDGTTKMRKAGTSEFHKTHQHFHLMGFAKLELLRVTDRSQGTLIKAGAGHKSGFCLVDLRIAQWRKFDQQRAYSARSNCSPVGGKAELGLSAGWTDVYGYDLSGNYVEFGNNGDGYYVVRATVDSEGTIRESGGGDNVGYAYIKVRGDDVTLLERGRGRSPWDTKKVVSREWWEATQ